MTKDEFQTILNNPCLVGKEHLPELKELVDSFPYVAAFRLLYLKGLHNVSDVRYASQVQTTALLVPSRRSMRSLIDLNLQQTVEQTPASDLSKEPVAQAVEPASEPYVYDIEREFAQKKTEQTETPMPKMKYGDLVDNYLAGGADSLFMKRSDKPATRSSDHTQPVRLNTETAQSAENEKTEKEEAPKVVVSQAFFTESLAKIYIKQGKFQKAINIFQNLCVKHPEKKEYFNDQIRFLEKLIQNL